MGTNANGSIGLFLTLRSVSLGKLNGDNYSDRGDTASTVLLLRCLGNRENPTKLIGSTFTYWVPEMGKPPS